MGAGTMNKVPPPPPGFTLIPPPPPGFTMVPSGPPAASTPPRVDAAGAAAAAAEDEEGSRQTRAPLDNWEYGAGLAEKVGQGFFANYGDELAAAMGSLANTVTGGRYGKTRQEILDDIRAREADFEERHPIAAKAGEFGGAIGAGVSTGVGALNLFRATPTMMRAAGIGGLSAAPLGALDATGRIEGPASAGDYAGAAGEGAAVAGGIGALTGAAGNVIGRTVGPWASRQAQELYRRGVRLTPGEVIGPRATRFEGNMAAMPIIGDMIRSRAEEGVESLNRAAYREALEPVGRRYQTMLARSGARTGHEAVDEMSDILEHRYSTVVPRMTAAVDQDLGNEATRIAHRLPESVRPEFVDAVRRHVDSVVDPATNTIPGRDLQQSLRSLREGARRLRSSTAHPWHPDLGDALDDLRGALEGSAKRHSNPADVREFKKINNAYSRFVRVRDAASRVTSEEGVFSPANLHGAVRAADRSAGKGQMARGAAVMQDLSGPARSVMKPKGGGSPTTERLALVGALTNPTLALKTLAAGIPAAALYSRPGSRAFQHLASASPQTRAVIRRAVERATTVAAPALGYEAERKWNDGH
jgi:hypothetical protein